MSRHAAALAISASRNESIDEMRRTGCGALARWRARGEQGSHFNLLVEDANRPDRLDRKLMLYRLFLEAPNGGLFTLVATKTCDNRNVIAGGDGGEMYLTLLDFLHQMTTYRSPNGLRKGLAAIARFDRMFVSHLWDAYLPNVLSSCPF